MKISIVLIISLAFSIVGYSQSYYLEAGINGSTHRVEDYSFRQLDMNTLKFGYQIGLFCEAEISNRLYFISGLYFVRKGAYLNRTLANYYLANDFPYRIPEDPTTQEPLDPERTLTIHPEDLKSIMVNYLEMPLSLKFFMPINELRPYVLFGSYLSLNLSGTLELKEGANSENPDNNLSIGAGKLSVWDIGLVSGIGIQQGKFDFALKYSHGILDVFWSRNTNTYQGVFNSTFTISLAYRLGE